MTGTKDSFSLLADDQSALASAEEGLTYLKAHLVLQALTNSTVTIPDSFLINNLNLRRLLAQDDTVRQLVSAGILQTALRGGAARHERGLVRLQTQFQQDGKLQRAVAPLGDDDLTFVQRNSTFRNWDLGAVARNYETLCAKALYSTHTLDALGEAKAEALRHLIEAETGGKIDRSLIYNRIEALFAAHGQPLTPENMAHLRLCVDAPYQSNLPGLLGLNPVYDASARPSFDLMRGVALETTQIDDGREMPEQIDRPQFVAGLADLPFSDIETFRDSGPFKAFIRAFTQKDDPDAVEDAFFELDIAIQAAILARYPDLRKPKGMVTKRKLVKYAHSYRKDGIGRLSDVVSIAMNAANIALPFGIGYLTGHLIDYVSGSRDTPAALRSPDQIAAHNKDMNTLERYLKSKGMADTLSFSEPLLETNSHQVETFIGQ